MGQPYFLFPSDVSCPFCGAEEQSVEDLGDNAFFLSGECGECSKQFSYDCGRCEYYDSNGEKIKS